MFLLAKVELKYGSLFHNKEHARAQMEIGLWNDAPQQRFLDCKQRTWKDSCSNLTNLLIQDRMNPPRIAIKG